MVHFFLSLARLLTYRTPLAVAAVRSAPTGYALLAVLSELLHDRGKRTRPAPLLDGAWW